MTKLNPGLSTIRGGSFITTRSRASLHYTLTGKYKNKALLYSLNILSCFTSEWRPFSWSCARAHPPYKFAAVASQRQRFEDRDLNFKADVLQLVGSWSITFKEIIR